jgi:hypothetical protein
MPLELHTILYQQFDYLHPEPFTDLISHTVIRYYPNSQVAYDGVIKTKRVNWDMYEFGELHNNRPSLRHDLEIEFILLLCVPEGISVPQQIFSMDELHLRPNNNIQGGYSLNNPGSHEKINH